MDSSCYSSLLGFVVCELSMPVKTHIAYSSLALDQRSSDHNLLTAGAEIAKENYEKVKETRAQNRTKLLSSSNPWFSVGKGRKRGSSTPQALNYYGVKQHAKKLKQSLKESKAKSKKNLTNMLSTTSTTKHTNNVEMNQILPDEEFDVGSHRVIKEEEVQPDLSDFEHLEGSACLEFQTFVEMEHCDELLTLDEDDFKTTFRISHSSLKVSRLDV